MRCVSWNLEHLRISKLTGKDQEKHGGNWKTFYHTVEKVDVIFLYESSKEHNAEAIATLMNCEAKADAWGCTEHYAKDEYVIALWNKNRITSVKANTGATARLKEICSGDRWPVAFNVTVHRGKTLCIAAWHAHGPAKQMTSFIFPRLLNFKLIHILVGDFNFEGGPDVPPAPGGVDFTTRKNSPFSFTTAKEKTKSSKRKSTSSPPDYTQGRRKSIRLEAKNTASSSVPDAPDQGKSASLQAKETTSSSSTDSGAPRRSVRVKEQRHLQEVRAPGPRRSSTFGKDGPTHRNSPLDRLAVCNELVGRVGMMLAPPKPGKFVTAKRLTDHVPLFFQIDLS